MVTDNKPQANEPKKEAPVINTEAPKAHIDKEAIKRCEEQEKKDHDLADSLKKTWAIVISKKKKF